MKLCIREFALAAVLQHACGEFSSTQWIPQPCIVSSGRCYQHSHSLGSSIVSKLVRARVLIVSKLASVVHHPYNGKLSSHCLITHSLHALFSSLDC